MQHSRPKAGHVGGYYLSVSLIGAWPVHLMTDTCVSRLREGRGGSSDLGVAALHHEISAFLCESEMMLCT